MKTKLTLSIDKNILEKAKKHFKKNDKSLSEVIENYLKEMIDADKKETPITDSLSGILKEHYGDKTYKEIRDEMIREKYGI